MDIVIDVIIPIIVEKEDLPLYEKMIGAPYISNDLNRLDILIFIII
jgi:hypothetical protein